MSRINDTSYIQIHGWMINKLGLSGRELMLFSLIYGFTKDSKEDFRGSRRFISEWLQCSLSTVDRTLEKLLGQNLITKTANSSNGLIYNSFNIPKEKVLKMGVGGTQNEYTPVPKMGIGGAPNDEGGVPILGNRYTIKDNTIDNNRGVVESTTTTNSEKIIHTEKPTDEDFFNRFEWLKNNYQSVYEQGFAMKRTKDLKKMNISEQRELIEKFNSSVIEREIGFEPHKVAAYLNKYALSWIKYNKERKANRPGAGGYAEPVKLNPAKRFR